jgi:hypothetical protein
LIAVAALSGWAVNAAPVAGSSHTQDPFSPVKAGAPLRDPPQYVSKNGLLRARIVVERHRVELAGRHLWALTYNGFYMPPTLRISPGDRITSHSSTMSARTPT